MLTILPPPCAAHHRHDRAAGQEHRGDVHVHHLPPLLERDLGERPHRERRVEAGVVDEDVDAAVALDGLVDHPLDVRLAERRPPGSALRRVQVGDHDRRALRRSPSAIAAPIPCAPPVTIATLPSSAHLIGENGSGIRIRFCCVCNSGCSCARKSFHASSACSSARRPRARRSLVAPELVYVESAPTSVVNAPMNPPR